jgi:NAD+-dependent protein deacetylase sirtuin 4
MARCVGPRVEFALELPWFNRSSADSCIHGLLLLWSSRTALGFGAKGAVGDLQPQMFKLERPMDADQATIMSPRGDGLDDVARLCKNKKVVVLAGAGLSTESGIPDYRGPETARRARNPIQGRQFITDAKARARYWARSLHGFPRIASASPNLGHKSLASLEKLGVVSGVITQNVDGLHQAAGSQRVIELHGALSRVRCLDCGVIESRSHLQSRLIELNPSWIAHEAPIAPDGDADLDHTIFDQFRVPPCLHCEGTLKPDVVFFGENVSPDIKDAAFSLFDESDVLLVVGSSLTVYSGFRFVRRANERSMPVIIINLGATRGDPHATVRLDARLGDVLPRLAQSLGAQLND